MRSFKYLLLRNPFLISLVYIFSFGSILTFSSCENTTKPTKKIKINPKDYQQVLEKINKYEIDKQSDEINQYIIHHGWNMKKTGTGLRYLILKKAKGIQPVSGNIVSVNYTISLLDGTVCYSSAKDGSKDFKVEGDNVESGLHEAVLLLHVGEKAKFILPSYMANGLLGDSQKIPPMSAIMVDMELLAVKEE